MQGRLEQTLVVLRLGAEQILDQLFAVDANHHLVDLGQVAEHQREVLRILEARAVGVGTGWRDGGRDLELLGANDKLLAALPVGDQVGDRDDPEIVDARELAEFLEALRIAIVVDDLGEDAHRRQPGRMG